MPDLFFRPFAGGNVPDNGLQDGFSIQLHGVEQYIGWEYFAIIRTLMFPFKMKAALGDGGSNILLGQLRGVFTTGLTRRRQIGRVFGIKLLKGFDSKQPERGTIAVEKSLFGQQHHRIAGTIVEGTPQGF